MKVVVFGAGHIGKRYCAEFGSDVEILAFVDNNKALHCSKVFGHPVVPVESISNYGYDMVVLAIADYIHGIDVINEALAQLNELGITTDQIYMPSKYSFDDLRVQTLKMISIISKHIPGDVAECGVHRGDFAGHINYFFPDRKLYLFDTFEGFDNEDVACEVSDSTLKWLERIKGYYVAGSLTLTKLKCAYPDKIEVRKGYIPTTFAEVEGPFAFLSLDVDLYKPTLEALRFFAPRLSNGGIIMLDDYYAFELRDSVLRAVEEFAIDYTFDITPIGNGYTALLTNFKKLEHTV